MHRSPCSPTVHHPPCTTHRFAPISPRSRPDLVTISHRSHIDLATIHPDLTTTSQEITEILENLPKEKTAGPTHIYGSHGWRNTNGSVTDRFASSGKGTPMPAGLQHKSTGAIPRDSLLQRRKLLTSMKEQHKGLADQVALPPARACTPLQPALEPLFNPALVTAD